ncbi:hypothetical protein N7474_005533 [Penicillium riverlandense]|uniref:uncharacterized protein n=1 Tax=Penicillium riverlandense TaxID=1903569 RepID=UPI002548D884|nr:uncharacterized protein N7474_005533 [Penicillium riverlandense]KAJ5819942.1 hypothetical protein N7474_005533 [Penicillium riverlandense]
MALKGPTITVARLAASFAFAPFLLIHQVTAVPWIGTEYIAVEVKTIASGYTYGDFTETAFLETQTEAIKPTAKNIDPIATQTTIYGSLTPSVTEIDLVIAPTDGVAITSYDYHAFYVNIVYTAPASCPDTVSKSITTAVAVNVPYQAETLLKATATITSTWTDSYIAERYSITQAMLAPTDIPSDVYHSLSSANVPYSYIACGNSDSYGGPYAGESGDYGGGDYAGCEEFTWYIDGSAFSGGYCCDGKCHYTWGISPLGLGLAIFFSWWGLFLIVGFLESWYVFRRTMLGQKSRRGLPYGWAFLCPILSCVSFMYVRGYPAKTPAEQEVLANRWQGMTGGEKFKLWAKHGFRRNDPTTEVLGYPASGGTAPGMAAPHVVGPLGAQQGYPRDGGEDAQPKIVTVSESERT